MKAALAWMVRALVLAAIVAGGNYLLYGESGFADHANRYAVVKEFSSSDYIGLKGDIWTGDPAPLPPCCYPYGFTNETLWAINTGYCGGVSWIETGWYQISTGEYRYKLIYKLPALGCQYTEVSLGWGGPAQGSFHNYRLEQCSGCNPNIWTLTLDNNPSFTYSVWTGWTNGRSNRLDAGGEVGGHATIGMQGGINSIQYKRGTAWYNLNQNDSRFCSEGYSLIYNGPHQNIFDWGYQLPGGCPSGP